MIITELKTSQEMQALRESLNFNIEKFCKVFGISYSQYNSWKNDFSKASMSARYLMSLVRFNPTLAYELSILAEENKTKGTHESKTEPESTEGSI